MAKLSISIPDELKVQLDERADAEHVPVSHVVTEALKAYFAQGPAPELPPGAGGGHFRAKFRADVGSGFFAVNQNHVELRK